MQHIGFVAAQIKIENLIIGVSMIITSLSILLLNMFIIRAIYQDKNLYLLTSYKFIFGLACADIVQLVIHFISGFYTIFQANLNPQFNKILGAIPCYKCYALLTVVLAINRLVLIACPHLDLLWFLLVFFIAAFFGVLHSSPYASILYDSEMWSWSYDFELPLSTFMQQISGVVEIGTVVIAGAIYVIIFVLLIHKVT
uniref:7TM GPCR serpentine receptor class x (Srx) domain-containing protein n=1 Tax=Ditylenchus dipsaci TaxID=166011 RepID=A0A915E9I7_9BILA